MARPFWPSVSLNHLETEQNRISINSIADIVDGHISSSPAYASAVPSSSSSLLSLVSSNRIHASTNINNAFENIIILALMEFPDWLLQAHLQTKQLPPKLDLNYLLLKISPCHFDANKK